MTKEAQSASSLLCRLRQPQKEK